MAIKEIVKGICGTSRCKYDVYTKEKMDELLSEERAYTDGTSEEIIGAVTAMLQMVPEIAMINVTLTGEVGTQVRTEVSYPEGFSKDNTNVVSIMEKWNQELLEDETVTHYWVSSSQIKVFASTNEIEVMHPNFSTNGDDPLEVKICIMMNPTRS